jgi:hypothetical protein
MRKSLPSPTESKSYEKLAIAPSVNKMLIKIGRKAKNKNWLKFFKTEILPQHAEMSYQSGKTTNLPKSPSYPGNNTTCTFLP